MILLNILKRMESMAEKIKEIIDEVIKIIEDKKGIDLKVLDVSQISSFTDYMIICSGANEKQIQAIADEIFLKLKKKYNHLPGGIEGYKNAQWILMDYFDFVVNIFSLEARETYDLDSLWKDGKTILSEV